ncbi:hypothetical protein TWF506_000548 [Arthrobotrys conoides]|uniref:Uncharacterized protein n=1 Tax=Arthrobotrys conoides TaxID=74498 RepID=A0AAN8NLR2_9PEZI
MLIFIYFLLQPYTLKLVLSSPMLKHPLESPPEPIIPSLNETTPNPQRRGPANGWYAEGSIIHCLSAEHVIKRWIQQSYPPNIGPIRQGDYRALHNVIESRPHEEAVQFIEEFKTHCYECVCMPGDTLRHENGDLLLKPPTLSPEKTRCESQEKADSCAYLLGCACDLLVYPRDDPEVTAASLFSALNKEYKPPPESRYQRKSKKGKGKGRRFNPMDLPSILEDQGSKDGAVGVSRERWLVPGTKEPYWLEGLDEEPEINMWDRFPGNLGGFSGYRYISG